MSSKTKRQHQDPDIESKRLAPVQDAVKEYRVIEDGAYAYHLQEAEIENHYSHNVDVRRMVQNDIKRAKELQDEEDRKARIMTVDEQQEVVQMDEELAEIIQEEIFKQSMQDEQQRKEYEERDKEIALLMNETERRRVENTKGHERRDRQLAERMQDMKVTPPGREDKQRMKLLTDEQLARRLQEEEKLKAERTRHQKQEMKSVVEMQDEELAKYIHDKDVETAEKKYRKERERRRKSKKGKCDDEPLYYDDNYNLPSRHDSSPRGDIGNSVKPRGHRHEEARLKNHSRDSQRHTPNGRHTPSSQDSGHSSRYEERRHQKDDRKRPERPPPPKFDKSHSTEVKVPLDDSQRRHDNERRSNRRSPHRERSREHEGSSSHHHRNRNRGSSEKHGRTRDLADGASVLEPHRSRSEKQRSGLEHERRPGSSRSRHDGDYHDRQKERHIPSRDHCPQNRNEQQDPRKRRESARPSSREEKSRLPTPKPRSKPNHSTSVPEF